MQSGQLATEQVRQPQHRKFGKCFACERWVARDALQGVNMSFFDHDNFESKVRVRTCRACWDKMLSAMRDVEWKNELRTAAELAGQQTHAT